ncbi:uncharacterized protein VP01_13248g1, partial [Puccinia sorghi]
AATAETRSHPLAYISSTTSVESMERITQWFGACVILHNYLLHNETPSISMADEDHSPSIIPDHFCAEVPTLLVTIFVKKCSKKFYHILDSMKNESSCD